MYQGLRWNRYTRFMHSSLKLQTLSKKLTEELDCFLCLQYNILTHCIALQCTSVIVP